LVVIVGGFWHSMMPQHLRADAVTESHDGDNIGNHSCSQSRDYQG